MLKKVLKITVWVLLVLIAVLVAVRLIAGLVMQRRLEAKLEELRSRGEPLTLAELAPPPIPDNENAAILYEEAFRAIDRLPEETLKGVSRLVSELEKADAELAAQALTGLLHPFGQTTAGGQARQGTPEEKEVGSIAAPTRAQLEEARRYLAEAKDVLRLLRQAAGRKGSKYAIDYRGPAVSLMQERSRFWYVLNHVGCAESTTELLRLSLRVHLAEKNPDEAIADCLGIYRLGGSLRNEPLLIAVLAEVMVKELAMGLLQCLLADADPSPDALREVLTAFGETGDCRHLAVAFKGERCFAFSAMPWVLSGHDPASGRDGVSWAILTFVFRPVFVADSVRYSDVIDECVALSHRPCYDAAEGWSLMMDKAEKRSAWMHPLSRFLVPTLRKGASVVTWHVGRRECARVAVCLRLYRMKHGRYPETLTALMPEFLERLPVDPFSGKDFIYRREGKGFIVYSVGVNGKDDGGTEDPHDRDAGDIVWKCSR